MQDKTPEVSLYALRGRVNQRFFGVLLVEEQLKQTALRRAKLQRGVITSHVYIAKVNASNAARQARLLHQIELLQAHHSYQTISGN